MHNAEGECFETAASHAGIFGIPKAKSRLRFRFSESGFACYAFRMPKELAEVLRRAIRDSGKPLLAIAQETGVGVATLSEFMAGADMRLKNASKIAAYLGLELTRPASVAAKRSKRGR